MIYGIVGSGKHPQDIIWDGLKDLYLQSADNTMYLWCRVGASESERRVYDWVLDNDITFNAVVDNTSVPKILLEAADYIHHADKVGSAADYIIKEVAANNGTLLLLWDSDDEAGMHKLVVTAVDMGVPVLELSNGLTPIIVDAEPVTEKPAAVETYEKPVEVTVEPLTTAELNDMSIGLLKKAAFAQGIADAGGMSKDQLVNVLSDTPEVASDTHVPQEPQAVVVYWENGSCMTVHVPLKDIKALLG